MKIIRLVHNEDSKCQLFGYIGEFAASTKARQELGGNINSQPNQVWFIAIENDVVLGFVSLVPHKNKHAKMVHLYLTMNRTSVKTKLMEKCISEAKSSDMKGIITIDFATLSEEYKKRGWTASTTKGRFTTYSMEL